MCISKISYKNAMISMEQHILCYTEISVMRGPLKRQVVHILNDVVIMIVYYFGLYAEFKKIHFCSLKQQF